MPFGPELLDNDLNNIWFPFPYDQVLITEDLFSYPSYIHGIGHTYRVMLLSAILAGKIGWYDCCRSVIWAASLHDTRRLKDGDDDNHGLRAVEDIVPKYLGSMKKQGMTEEEISSVVFSIQQHCRDINIIREEPFHKVLALLKEADALDRVRMNGLDVSMLNLQDKLDTLSLAKSFYLKLLNHLILVKGNLYSPICHYTMTWISSGGQTHQQYMKNCMMLFGKELTIHFFSYLNCTDFYLSFLHNHTKNTL